MKYLRILLGAVLIAIVIGLIVYLPQKLIINEIVCQSQFGPCNSSVLGSIDVIKNGERSYQVIKNNLYRELSSNILVSDYSFHYQFPDKIQVDILERKPKYAIKPSNADAYALADKEGFVIYYQDTTGLPILDTSESAPDVGEQVSDRIRFGLELLYGVFSSHQVKNGKIEDNSLVIELNQGPKVIFPLEGDKEVLLGSLVLVLSKLNNEDQDSKIENVSGASIIDLRFNNPVIK